MPLGFHPEGMPDNSPTFQGVLLNGLFCEQCSLGDVFHPRTDFGSKAGVNGTKGACGSKGRKPSGHVPKGALQSVPAQPLGCRGLYESKSAGSGTPQSNDFGSLAATVLSTALV